MNEYESNAEFENSTICRKKEDFMIYYKDFDSNLNKKDDTMSKYERLIKVKITLFHLILLVSRI